MGDVLSCFKGQQKSEGKKNKSSEESTTLDDIKGWEYELGCKDQSLLLTFTYDEKIKHYSFRQIEKDVDRTFPDLREFNQEVKKKRFVTALKKFSIYFPKTGYTQGLNFLAGYILLSDVEESHTFMLITKICIHPDLMLLGLYEDNFPLNRLYCEIFWIIMEEKKPRVTQLLRQASFMDQIWIFQWFMTFFIMSFPLYLINHFWDYALSRKGFAFVKLAIGIINELEHIIIKKFKGDGDYLQFFENLKDKNFCKKNIRIQKLLKFADSISDDYINDCLKKTKCGDNFYREYFLCHQNQRKALYLMRINKMREQRKAFQTNPNLSSFSRDENDITVLDYIITQQYQKMYNSLDPYTVKNAEVSEPKRNSLFNYQMWKSDLHSLKRTESNEIKNNN